VLSMTIVLAVLSTVFALLSYAATGSPYLALLYPLSTALVFASLRAFIPYFNSKRALALELVAFISILPAEIVGQVLHVYGLLYVTVPLFSILVCKGVHRNTRSTMGIAATVLGIEALFSFASHESLFSLAFRCAIVLFSMALSYRMLHLIDALGRRLGVDAIAIANAWAKYALTGDSTDLEKVFHDYGREYVAKVSVLAFDRDRDRVAIIVPGVHFGPFRSLGSSPLPHQVDEVLEKIGVKHVLLHGAGSHEIDIVTNELSRRFAEELAKVVRLEGKETEVYEPYRVVANNREAFVIPTSRLSIVAISSPLTGGDDLPIELQERATKLAEMYGMDDVVVVDCHNLEGPRCLDIEEFEPLLRRALSSTTAPCNSLRVGYGEDYARGYVRGLCSNKVKVLALECHGKRYALIYLFGNNAQVGLRDRLRRIALEEGFADCEVVTADDHLCTATTFDVPYYAVEPSPVLDSAVRNALRKALNDLSECKARAVFGYIKTRVLGEYAFTFLRLAEEIGRSITRRFAIYIGAINVLSSIFVVLRGLHLI